MTAGRALALVLLAVAGAAATPAEAAPREVGPLPFLPSVARVRVGVTRDRVVVTHAITLPRGEWRGGDLDLYVAFGGPGAPLALDARLHAVADGELEAREADAAGEPVSYERAPSRPASAHLLLGRPRVAGVVLHVREAAFRAASQRGMGELRIRELYTLPVEEPDGEREVRVRLGATSGAPLTLARVQVVALEPELTLSRAGAHLCGPDADPHALALLPPRPPPSARDATEAPIAPVLAVRRPTDDLCVRFGYTAPAAAPTSPQPAK